MKKMILLTVMLMLAYSSMFAQSQAADSIYTRNGMIIICKVKEIGTTEIKYLQPDINSEVLYNIETSKIDRIVFSNGQVQSFSGVDSIEKNSQDLFETQKRKALKIDFISLAASSLYLTYEQCLKPGQSVEFSAGYIGIGPGMGNENPSGIMLRGGYKLMRNPDFYLKGMRYSHILKGAYLKLELDFASYSVDNDNSSNSADRINNTKFAGMVVLGNQWVYSDRFLIDLYSGIGIGTNNLKDDDTTYPYGFAVLPDTFPLAFSVGLRLGFLFK